MYIWTRPSNSGVFSSGLSYIWKTKARALAMRNITKRKIVRTKVWTNIKLCSENFADLGCIFLGNKKKKWARAHFVAVSTLRRAVWLAQWMAIFTFRFLLCPHKIWVCVKLCLVLGKIWATLEFNPETTGYERALTILKGLLRIKWEVLKIKYYSQIKKILNEDKNCPLWHSTRVYILYTNIKC